MKETTKSNKRRKGTWLFEHVFSGNGIDIGAGEDPLRVGDFPQIMHVVTFDWDDGNAQYITQHVADRYDFVYSSNCLEHMSDPVIALREWWSLVVPDGHLIMTVPDEDLYEQGRFKSQSKFSKDHRHSFTMYKRRSWCRWSHNIVDMVLALPNCQIIKLELVDTNFDYTVKGDQTMGDAEAFIEVVLKKVISYGL